MKKPNKTILYDKSTTDGQYEKLFVRLSDQRVSRPMISFKTIYHKNQQLTETKADVTERNLTVILDAKDKQSLQSANGFELYVQDKELKFDIDYAVTFETTRFYEVMTKMSSNYLIAFVEKLNSDDLTLLDKQRLIATHCRDLSYHVAKSIRPVRLPDLAWKKTGKDKWQITLGFMLGTLVRRNDESYELYVTSRDKTILLNKARKIQSDDTSRSIFRTSVELMERELERYRRRLNVTRQAIDYVQDNQMEPIHPNTIYRDMERDNELLVLRHKQATMYDSIERTENDHYQWCLKSKDAARHELRTKLGKSGQFNMLLYGIESDRDMYGTTYSPIFKPMFGVTLADVIPEDTHSDEWVVTLNNKEINVRIKHLHGTSEYRCLQLNPDVKVDDGRLENMSMMLSDPIRSNAEIENLMRSLTQPLGPMYERLK